MIVVQTSFAMKKILVPTDFSENANHALRAAAVLAVRAGVPLEILHANTALAYAPVFPEYAGAATINMDDYEETAAAELYKIKTDLSAEKQFADLEIVTRIEEGFLYTAISRVAEEDGANLIVMGTKGATGATEFFIGSNTEKVIRTATCPVLAVPDKSGDFFDIKKVVLATTLQPDQAPVFRTLAAWQNWFPFDVELLYLNNPADLDTNEEIEALATRFSEASGLKRINANVSADTFNEEASILQFAKAEKADLIVMGTHQRKGLSHLLFGSLTEDTVNHANIPVLSIPIR